MTKKKKKEKGIIEDMTPTFKLASGAMGSSLLGGTFESKLPAGVTNPLTTTGTTMGKFVAPMAMISASGMVMKQMKKTEKKLKGGKK